MKLIENQATRTAGLSLKPGKRSLSTEAMLCFGAAGGCLVLGLIGYAINALTTMETTLSAFLVISAFYLMLGVISLFKHKPADAIEEANVLPVKRPADFESADYADEAAA